MRRKRRATRSAIPHITSSMSAQDLHASLSNSNSSDNILPTNNKSSEGGKSVPNRTISVENIAKASIPLRVSNCFRL